MDWNVEHGAEFSRAKLHSGLAEGHLRTKRDVP